MPSRCWSPPTVPSTVPAMAAKVDVDLSAIGGRALFSGNVSPDDGDRRSASRASPICRRWAPLLGRDLSGALAATLNGTVLRRRRPPAGDRGDRDRPRSRRARRSASLLAGQTHFALTLSDDFAGRLASRMSRSTARRSTLPATCRSTDRPSTEVSPAHIADLALLADQSTRRGENLRQGRRLARPADLRRDRRHRRRRTRRPGGRRCHDPRRGRTGRRRLAGALTLGGSFAGTAAAGHRGSDARYRQRPFRASRGRSGDRREPHHRSDQQADDGLLCRIPVGQGAKSRDAGGACPGRGDRLGRGRASASSRMAAARRSTSPSPDAISAAATLVAKKADGNIRIDDALGTPQIAGNDRCGGDQRRVRPARYRAGVGEGRRRDHPFRGQGERTRHRSRRRRQSDHRSRRPAPRSQPAHRQGVRLPGRHRYPGAASDRRPRPWSKAPASPSAAAAMSAAGSGFAAPRSRRQDRQGVRRRRQPVLAGPRRDAARSPDRRRSPAPRPRRRSPGRSICRDSASRRPRRPAFPASPFRRSGEATPPRRRSPRRYPAPAQPSTPAGRVPFAGGDPDITRQGHARRSSSSACSSIANSILPARRARPQGGERDVDIRNGRAVERHDRRCRDAASA